MREMTEQMAGAFELTAQFEFRRNHPPTINHAAETGFVREVLTGMAGAENVLDLSPPWAPKTSYYCLKSPASYSRSAMATATTELQYGLGLYPCNNPSYDFNDELIPWGSMWVRLVSVAGTADRNFATVAAGPSCRPSAVLSFRCVVNKLAFACTVQVGTQPVTLDRIADQPPGPWGRGVEECTSDENASLDAAPLAIALGAVTSFGSSPTNELLDNPGHPTARRSGRCNRWPLAHRRRRRLQERRRRR